MNADDEVLVRVDEHVIHEVEDVIDELEWESPARWAPVIDRLRPLVARWRSESAGDHRAGRSLPHPGQGPSGSPR
jgi:hypothetical protein